VNAYKYLFSIVEEGNGEKSVERNIDNDVLATVINKDGYLQIGENIYRFTRDYYLKTDVKNMHLLQLNDFSSKKDLVMRVDIKRIRTLSDQNRISERSVIMGECTTTSGNTRVKGIIEVEDVFDNDCVIITKHQKKVLGIWWANATSISVSFSGNFVKIWGNCSPAPQGFFSGSVSENSNSSLTRTVPGDDPQFLGCNGSATPYHDGQYLSTHTAGGKTCMLSCEPGSSCQ
jgi:hypothetical protein